jgi:hypothetical protein
LLAGDVAGAVFDAVVHDGRQRLFMVNAGRSMVRGGIRGESI